MLKRIYDWCIDAADKPYALWILAAVAFAVWHWLAVWGEQGLDFSVYWFGGKILNDAGPVVGKAALERAGVVFTRLPETEDWGGRVASFLDPDGNEIELYIDVAGVDWANDPALIGYFLMNEPTWGSSSDLPAVGMDSG